MEKELKEEKQKTVKEMNAKTVNDMTIVVDGEEGRIFRFTMPFYSPLSESYNASVAVVNEIVRLFNEAVEKQKALKEKEENDKITSEENESRN